MVEITNLDSRLRAGMIILIGRHRYRVDLVNESRARCIPIERPLRDYLAQTGRNAGKRRVYFENPPPISISPNSEVEILS